MDVAIRQRDGQIIISTSQNSTNRIYAVRSSPAAVLNRNIVSACIDARVEVGIKLHCQTVRDATARMRCAATGTLTESNAAPLGAQRTCRRGRILNQKRKTICIFRSGSAKLKRERSRKRTGNRLLCVVPSGPGPKEIIWGKSQDGRNSLRWRRDRRIETRVSCRGSTVIYAR